MTTLLQEIVGEIEAEPHSAAALTLYALVSTLEFERAGYLFKLAKLSDLSAPQRQLAYRLIESVVGAGGVSSAQWEAAKARMDELVRQG